MTTTERYSKANALSSQTIHATEMGNFSLPTWKQQLLERKAVNERIWKQAESKKARAALTSLNKDFEKTFRNQTYLSDTITDVSHGIIHDEQGSVSFPGPTKNSTVDIRNVKVSGNRHVELMSPQPYNNKNKLRNKVPLNASVVEEAVVKVKENPFKFMESEKVVIMESHTRTSTLNENNRPTTPEPIYMNAHIEKQIPLRGRKTARVEPQVVSQLESEACENNSRIAKEFSHVRSIWENRDTKASIRNFGFTFKSPDATDSEKFHNRPQSRYDSSFNDSVYPEVPHRVDSINIVADQFPTVDAEGIPDSMPSEMPLPNTVSSLKNVYECKDTQNLGKAEIKFRLRDKTPPPAGFRRIHTNNVSPNESWKLTICQSTASSGSRDDRPTATVRPVVLCKPIEDEKEELSQGLKRHYCSSSASDTLIIPAQNTTPHKPVFKSFAGSGVSCETRGGLLSNNETVTSIQYKDNVCVENYVPKFVHEYTSHRVTSLLNSLIRDSISFRIIPNAVTHHSPMSTNNAVIMESVKSTATVLSKNNIHPPSASVLKNETHDEKQETSFDSTGGFVKSFEDATATVIVVEKSETDKKIQVCDDASRKAFDSVGDDRLEEESPTPTVVPKEDATHPQILVFQQSFLEYKNSDSDNKEAAESTEAGEISELISRTLPVVTSFKDDSPSEHRSAWEEPSKNSCSAPHEEMESMKRTIGVKGAIIVISTPLPPDLKSCISQKLKAVSSIRVSNLLSARFAVSMKLVLSTKHFVFLHLEAGKRRLITAETPFLYSSQLALTLLFGVVVNDHNHVRFGSTTLRLRIPSRPKLLAFDIFSFN